MEELTTPVGGGFTGVGLEEAVPPEAEVFRCEEHGKTFKSKQGLRLHLTRSHGAEKASRPRKRKSVLAATPAPKEFDAGKLLTQVSPNGHIPTAHFERVHAFVEEGRRLHNLLRG